MAAGGCRKQICIRTNVGTDGSTAKSTAHSVQGKVRETKGARKRRARPTTTLRGDAKRKDGSRVQRVWPKKWCLRQVSRMRVAREWALGCRDPQCRETFQQCIGKLEIPSSIFVFTSLRLKTKTANLSLVDATLTMIVLWTFVRSDRTCQPSRLASRDRRTRVVQVGAEKKKGRKAWLHP